MFKEQIKSAILVFLILTIITGVIYPLFVTAFCQLFFHNKANGSLIYKDGKPIGSSFIGQYFDKPEYFWPRPSATSPMPYNAASSCGSNLGPSNPLLNDALKKRIELYKAADPNNTNQIPVDLVTASASGLDPHISLAGAYYQTARISRIRNLSQETVENLINKHATKRLLGILGEPVVNVLELNVGLDEYKK